MTKLPRGRRPAAPSEAPARPDRRRPAGPPAAGPVPDAARLRDAALLHLSRYAATEAGLRRVLERRVATWARRAEAEGQPPERIAAAVATGRVAATEIARRMTAAGAVDDTAFAATRALRLQRAGKSRRAIAAHLAAKGVAADTAAAALPESDVADLLAALATLRRRRAGPFAATPPDTAARLKAMGALARAGFARDVVEQALDTPPEEAEAMLLASRRG
ncbi:regulatory protein RecX [Humitalea sp. 24SJ18S-53]|uniref:regulatory protein RecX n=1 Tax=Humitalea sp. 24SJ18S-53 TaxID=3422307 RepID=UPI003D66F1BD